MGIILTFLSEHNALIIKILSIGVALTASFLLYRVVFVQANGVAQQSTTADLTEVNKKVNEQKIEIETLKSETQVAKDELEKQRTEVYNLRQTIKEKETEIETSKAEIEQLKTGLQEKKILDYEKHNSEVILSTTDENLIFQKEIAELKRRLSDYEIIAEDISDIQRLKEENDKLKRMINGETAETLTAETLTAETLTAETLTAETLTAETSNVTKPAPGHVEKETLKMTPVPEVKKQVAQAPNSEPVKAQAEPAKDKKIVVEIETLDGVTEVEKNLMEKFEKQKGS